MNHTRLAEVLNHYHEEYHNPGRLTADPLGCVRALPSIEDREIGGLLAASLAYGRVETIIQNVSRIFALTAPSITHFAQNMPLRQKKAVLRGFKHRFTDGESVSLLLHAVGIAVKSHGSLENLFAEGLKDTDTSIKSGLERFVAELHGIVHQFSPDHPGVAYLLSSPASGSACKRLAMYLRWMVRPDDGIDLGIWKRISPSQLIIPIDTHIARAAKSLGLTRRSSVSWAMAEEITDHLKRVDPSDPVKYDFSLCHSGMVSLRKEAA